MLKQVPINSVDHRKANKREKEEEGLTKNKGSAECVCAHTHTHVHTQLVFRIVHGILTKILRPTTRLTDLEGQ